MDAPPASPEPSRELEVLRWRAYGPDADIHRDPDAQRRLQELEDLARVPEPAGAELEPDPEGRAEAPTIPSAGAPRAAEPIPDVAAPSDSARPEVPWWRRTKVWTPLVSLALVAVVAGVALPAAWSPRADASLAPLAEQEDRRHNEWVRNLKDWFRIEGELTEHEAFHRLRVFTGLDRDGGRCLIVAVDPAQGWADGSCTPDGLAPIVDYQLTSGSPQPMDDPLPTGSVVRFTLNGDVVEVTVREGSPTRPTDLLG